MSKTDIREVFAFKGQADLEFPNGELDIKVVSEGASFFICLPDSDDEILLHSGQGSARLRYMVGGPFVLRIKQKPGQVTSLFDVTSRRFEVPSSVSYTDLESVYRNPISPEMRAVMDQMNRNAIIREQAMLRSLGNRSD